MKLRHVWGSNEGGSWRLRLEWGYVSETLKFGEDKNRQRGDGRGGSFLASECSVPSPWRWRFIHSLTHLFTQHFLNASYVLAWGM